MVAVASAGTCVGVGVGFVVVVVVVHIVFLYFPINEADESIVLNGVLNSCDAIVTKRDFISFNSFSFSSAALSSSLEISNSCSVSFKIFVQFQLKTKEFHISRYNINSHCLDPQSVPILQVK